jgi:hypothetical protein
MLGERINHASFSYRNTKVREPGSLFSGELSQWLVCGIVHGEMR